MACDVELLRGISYFELLTEDDRKALAQSIGYLKLPAGKTLFHAGELGDSLFLLRSGKVELSVKDHAGQKIVLKIAKQGDQFGELALLDSGPRSATAYVLSDSELLVLGREDLRVLFQKKPEAALHLMAAMSAMTRRADELLRARVARNVNVEVEGHAPLPYRAARAVARFGGTLHFLALNSVFFGVWFVINAGSANALTFDPFPFDLVKTIVPLEALFLSMFVLISQKQQADKDRVRADVEYDVNVQAELKVAHLHEKVDRLYETMLERFVRLEKTLTRTA
ncbi:MAG: DUF1003 domain-containing protein [Candidatus Acidiferrales bacterium]